MLRDLRGMWGQALAIAFVIVAGVATFVAMTATMDSLQRTLDTYYEDYRFADVFASIRRAPERMHERLRRVPGVGRVQTRVVAGVNLEIPDFEEPVTGQIVSIPESRQPSLNQLFVREGRLVRPGREDEVVLNEAFAEAHAMEIGSTFAAIINGRRKKLTVVGIALSPEHLMQVQPGSLFPDPKRFGVMWMGRSALAAAYDMEGAFNDATFALAPGARVQDVVDRLDVLIALTQRTIDENMDELHDGSVIVYDGERTQMEDVEIPDGMIGLSVPLKRLAEDAGGAIMRNVVALGAACEVADFPIENLDESLEKRFGDKGEAIVENNKEAARLGQEYVADEFAVFVDPELRHDEQADPLRALRCVGQARQVDRKPRAALRQRRLEHPARFGRRLAAGSATAALVELALRLFRARRIRTVDRLHEGDDLGPLLGRERVVPPGHALGRHALGDYLVDRDCRAAVNPVVVHQVRADQPFALVAVARGAQGRVMLGACLDGRLVSDELGERRGVRREGGVGGGEGGAAAQA